MRGGAVIANPGRPTPDWCNSVEDTSCWLRKKERERERERERESNRNVPKTHFMSSSCKGMGR